MSELEANVDGELAGSVNDILRVAAEEVPIEDAQKTVAIHYGIAGSVSRLTSERDQNFRIDGNDGHEYALKISNPVEDPTINEFQVRALLHVESVDPPLPVPRVIRALNGHAHLRLAYGHHAERAVRLLSYLPGVPLYTVERTAAQRQQLGALLARLGLALRGFFHSAAGHDLAWDIKNASRLRALIAHIPDVSRRQMVEAFLDNFERHAQLVLPRLRAQVVHNDLNPHNVLVDPADHDRVAGILDFGDMVHTSLINDVAVGASYHMSGVGSEDPWDCVAQFVAAYHAVSPLERVELDLLYDLIAARFVLTVSITGWRAARYPENSAYILKNNASAWSGLAHLSTLRRDEAQRRLRAACNME
ncbi:phosphotransferase [Caballeronia sp. dw_276]|jgi:Ser/Thr protein kinase RdoA (MazF antagonist)|uniref:phosphotransferase n=1 Tax=Caballeronia sp. dw_276 TaxID=2719795 RepID=UPI001BD49983|nr:phosphotransferase [Caballeronia sp. dw_276]